VTAAPKTFSIRLCSNSKLDESHPCMHNLCKLRHHFAYKELGVKQETTKLKVKMGS
jgi:hypothetical protein